MRIFTKYGIQLSTNCPHLSIDSCFLPILKKKLKIKELIISFARLFWNFIRTREIKKKILFDNFLSYFKQSRNEWIICLEYIINIYLSLFIYIQHLNKILIMQIKNAYLTKIIHFFSFIFINLFFINLALKIQEDLYFSFEYEKNMQ